MPSPHRTILNAALPLFLSMSAGIIAQLLGTALLGHQGTAQLAAFALVCAVLNPVTAAVSGGLRGMSPFVAACRDRPAEALPILKDARWLSLGIGVVGAGVMLAVPLIARLSGVPYDLGALPQIFALQVLLAAAGGGANGVLIALGHSRLVLRSGLTSTAAEVILLLALVPPMGAHGAALALLASTALALTLSNALLLGRPEFAGQSLLPRRPRPRQILRMARLGIPMSASIVLKFAVMGGATYAAARTGPHAAAAHAILAALDGLLGLAAFAVAQAVTPEIARSHGPADARRANRAALAIASAGTLAAGLALLLLGAEALGPFTSDPRVLAAALPLLPLLLIYALANNCGIVLSAGLMGLRRSSWSLGSAVLGYGLLAVAMTPVTAAWSLTGLWTALTAARGLILAVQAAGFTRHSARLPISPRSGAQEEPG
ncbi:MATE family efflux transporter [Nonomuraea sp. KM90]|uniref:MATE family efflux transporter n=1 Tax=Nonomuraea sp. KM90 TaxID=3457428 RepID=UPI003FCEAF09